MARTRRRPSYRKSKRWNPPKSRSGRRGHRSKGSRRAKRSQSRRGIRASARGFRKMKRRGRTRVTGRTFRKLRRHAKNPKGSRGRYDSKFTHALGQRGRHARGSRRFKKWHGSAHRWAKARAGTNLIGHKMRGSRSYRGRNPGGVYHRTLRDGSKVTVRDDGEIVVHDERGVEYDRYRVKPYEVNRVLKGLGTGKYATKGHYHYDSVQDDYQSLSRNPRGRRGRGRGRTRRNCGGSRRNPAQFPMPFVSAMNPGRRRGKRGGMRTRRNHPISRRDARSMKRVLRQHKYKCR